MFLAVPILALVAWVSASCSKYDGMSGSTLRAQLKKDYYDGKYKQLGYTKAREYMYGYIDNKNSIVDCFYSGWDMACPYGSMNTGCNSNMNCEHIVPKAFFDEKEPMKGDIHHLRPTWDDVNNARSNYPFEEIPADKAYKWFKDGVQTTSAPPSNQQYMWSRLKKSTSFEPRDEAKGAVARAIGYFFTVYPKEIGYIREIGDMNLLVDWNEQFPPDDDENQRNDLVEQYQGNRNPYIDCPNLLEKAYSDYL